MEKLLVIDIQPMYHAQCQYATERLVDKLNKETPETIWYYVAADTGIGDDTEADVFEYLESRGLSAEAFENITFVPKDYGFLRGWMDTGVDEETIVDTLKLMRQLGVTDSRDLKDILTEDDTDHEHVMRAVTADHSEAVFEPGFDVRPLLSQPQWTVAGGGMYECLKELELYALSHDVKFEVKDCSLIYG